MRKVIGMGFKKWWKNMSYWKQGYFVTLSIFISVFLFSFTYALTIDSDMASLALGLPFGIIFLIKGYNTLNIPFRVSIIFNLFIYLIVGFLITFLINKLKCK